VAEVSTYVVRQPIYRKYHRNELTFGLLYAFFERFILPLSHDEVVGGDR
jgi:1,4-alpha-glucan branching enzyme